MNTGSAVRKLPDVVSGLLVAAALVVIGYFVPDFVRHGQDLLSAVGGRPMRDEIRRVVSRPVAVRPFLVKNVVGAPHVLDLSHQSALVLIFDDDCHYCDLNMPHWLELVVEAHRNHVPVYALARGDVNRESAYWRGLEHSVDIGSTLDSAALTDVFGATGTPYTVWVRRGHVAARMRGAIDAAHESWLIREISRTE